MEVLVMKSSLVCWSHLQLYWLQYGALYSSKNIASHKCHFHVVHWPLINPRLMLSLHLVSLWRTGSLPVKCWNKKTITTDKRFVLNLYWKGRGNSWWGIGEKTIIRHFTNVQFANALGHFDNTLDHHKALESLFNLVFLTSWNGSQKSWHWNKYSQIFCVCVWGGWGGGAGRGRGRGMVEGGNTVFFLYEVVCCCMDRVWFPKIPRVYNWRAPSKGGIRTYFVAIFQVARNLRNFGMLTLFCVKKCPWVSFFTSGETRLQTRSWKSSPPSALFPPPPPPMA